MSQKQVVVTTIGISLSLLCIAIFPAMEKMHIQEMLIFAFVGGVLGRIISKDGSGFLPGAALAAAISPFWRVWAFLCIISFLFSGGGAGYIVYNLIAKK